MSGAPPTANILVVDGDPLVRASFTHALTPLGEVEVAANGLDALRILAGKKFDVILLDLATPGVDGYIILKMLANRRGPNQETPVYALTADVSEHARERAMREHATFVLTKPVPMPTLVTLIGAALAPRTVSDSEHPSPLPGPAGAGHSVAPAAGATGAGQSVPPAAGATGAQRSV